MVLGRADAEDEANAAEVRASRFVYLGGGSPMHLRSVLKASPVWEALLDAWRDGAVVAGSSAGAMVLTDPMVDPRGGALTVGLGMVEELAVIPHFGDENAEKVHRSIALAAPGLPVVGLPERTALIRDPDGAWRQAGQGTAQVFVSGKPAGLDALPLSPRLSAGARAPAVSPPRRWSPTRWSPSPWSCPSATPRRRWRPPTSRPGHHLAEQRVAGGQAHAVGARDDEELAAVGVGPGVGHGQRPSS